MEKSIKYRKAILDAIEEYQSRFRLTSQDLRYSVIADKKNNKYQFLWTGWHREKHIFNVAFHMEIIGDKVWIQEDKTEDGIANLLVDKGIPKSDIVLAYYSPSHRKLTEFAVN